MDNNCYGGVDEGVEEVWYADLDSDGYGDGASAVKACEPPVDYTRVAGDCDDSAPSMTLRSTGGPDVTLFDAQQEDTVFLFTDGEGLDSQLDGFALVNGDCPGALCRYRLVW